MTPEADAPPGLEPAGRGAVAAMGTRRRPPVRRGHSLCHRPVHPALATAAAPRRVAAGSRERGMDVSPGAPPRGPHTRRGSRAHASPVHQPQGRGEALRDPSLPRHLQDPAAPPLGTTCSSPARHAPLTRRHNATLEDNQPSLLRPRQRVRRRSRAGHRAASSLPSGSRVPARWRCGRSCPRPETREPAWIVVSEPGTAVGGVRPVVRGTSFDTPPPTHLRRIDLLAYMWQLSARPTWLWILLLGSFGPGPCRRPDLPDAALCPKLLAAFERGPL